MNTVRRIVAEALWFLSGVAGRMGLVNASAWLIRVRSDVLWARYKE